MIQMYSVDDVIPDRMYGIYYYPAMIIGKSVLDTTKRMDGTEKRYFLQEMIWVNCVLVDDHRLIKESVRELDDPNYPDGDQWHMFYEEDFIFELSEAEVLNHIVANRL